MHRLIYCLIAEDNLHRETQISSLPIQGSDWKLHAIAVMNCAQLLEILTSGITFDLILCDFALEAVACQNLITKIHEAAPMAIIIALGDSEWCRHPSSVAGELRVARTEPDMLESVVKAACERIVAIPLGHLPPLQSDWQIRCISTGNLDAGKMAGDFLQLAMNSVRQANENAHKAQQALQKAKDELFQSTKLASIGELAAGIAHDVNTPLTCIGGFIRLFLRFLDKPDITVSELVGIRHYLEKACHEVEVCQDIIKNLLLFARKDCKQYQPFSICDLVARVQSLLQEQLRQGKVVFLHEVPASLPLVMGSANQIQQVLVNLMVNAKNAMAQGGKLTLGGSHDDKSVYLRLADTGVGIPQENFSHLFEPFYTTDVTGKGTGLGLSICKKIMDEHGGKISVASEVGKGTVFTLQLPAATKAETGK